MSNVQLVKPEEKSMEFIPYGCQDKIKLTAQLVQNLIAVPTRSGRTCSERDAIKFMMLCQAKRLNPFEGDAYLIGYDGKDGPQFSLITAHQAFLKRAELHPSYDGMKSGIIIQNEGGSMTDTEGDFHTEEQTVVGGWATVFFKDRKYPMHKRLRLSRFRKNFGVWLDDPAGMIVKCAEADALRSSFPTMLGGLYLREEIDFPISSNEKVKEIGSLVQVVETGNQPAPEPNGKKVEEVKNLQSPARTPQQDLAVIVFDGGFDFTALQKWGIDTGNIENAGSLSGFDEIPEAVCKRLIRAKTGLLAGLAEMKGAGK